MITKARRIALTAGCLIACDLNCRGAHPPIPAPPPSEQSEASKYWAGEVASATAPNSDSLSSSSAMPSSPVPVEQSAAAPLRVYTASTDEELARVPWLKLEAGDEVRIRWKPEPYRVKLGLRSRGSKTAPIRIVGVPGPDGALPVLDAAEATTPDQFRAYNDGKGYFNEYVEGASGFLIFRGYLDRYGHKPGHIVLEGLRFTGANSGNHYRNMAGKRVPYSSGASGIWALAEHLTVRRCQIDDNGNGFFVQSSGGEAETSRDILFEFNRVFNNGNVWDPRRRDREHNIYSQAGTSATFQYNYIGQVRAGTGGSGLKDRSSNLVVRYNWIDASARALDLVEAEENYRLLSKEPGYHTTFVYGNVIVDDIDSQPHSTSVIHYGADNEISSARVGPHHFYHNTVVVTGTGAKKEYRVSIFDCGTDSTGDQAANNKISIVAQNNIFYFNPKAVDGEMALMRFFGSIKLEGANWLSAGWRDGRTDFLGHVTKSGQEIVGTTPPFLNEAARDFSILDHSPVRDKASMLPEQLRKTHAVDSMYQPDARRVPRPKLGAAFDLGAFEGSVAGRGHVTKRR